MSNKPTNLLLASLSAADLKLLEPHLRPLELQQQKVLFEAGQSVSIVYFPYDAVVSLVVTLSTGEAIEAAMVGRDGVVGALAALDGRISLSRAVPDQRKRSELRCRDAKTGDHAERHATVSGDPP